ncbi:MAG: ATP synthase subunit I [Clostridiales bacterium]|nr:ATP synthase subunit I [Clostridiales bacterium]
MKLDPEVLEENRKMAVGCLICSLLMAVGFLIARRFDLSVLFGIVIGFLLAVGNFFFMSVGITRALATGDEAAAKTKMRSSYIVRTIVMLAVMALSLAVDRIHWLPVLASVFYPRIVLTARNLWSWYQAKKHPLPPEEEAPRTDADPDAIPARSLPADDADADGDEKPDEFEKFVSHFSKGPVPGKEQKNDGAPAPDEKDGASDDHQKAG